MKSAELIGMDMPQKPCSRTLLCRATGMRRHGRRCPWYGWTLKKLRVMIDAAQIPRSLITFAIPQRLHTCGPFMVESATFKWETPEDEAAYRDALLAQRVRRETCAACRAEAEGIDAAELNLT